MRCSICASDNPEGLKFCNQCGAPFKARCSKCGFDNIPGAKFCGECGASLSSGTPARPEMEAPRAAATPESRLYPQSGERRHLTVLFCDLIGSTELAASLDPEEWQETVAAYHRSAAEAIGRFGGQVAKYLGDGVMAYFGYPEAHDNDAERAARAGLATLEAISKLNHESVTGFSPPGRPKLSARIGIDSGAVVVGAGAGTGTDIFGEAPNIAARVQAAAAPDTVLISAATHRLVAGLFVIEDCGAHALKGLEQPLQLYRVIQPAGVRGRLAAAAVSHGLTPFVGREDELRLLTNRWQRVLDGEGQVVLIIGEAGIGKSRLVQQFQLQLARTPHTWVEAAAAPFYQNTPFYPVAEALWKLVWEQSLNRFGDYLRELQNKESGHNSTDAAKESLANGRLDELQSGLISAGLKPAEAIPLIAPLLHLPLSATYTQSPLAPEQQRRRLLATLIDWLLGAARGQPLAIVIEDLHWADPSTLELIQLLAEQGVTAPLLLLYTARPEFRAEWPLRAHHTQIALNRLSTRNVREMIAQVAAQDALTKEALDAVIERTSGVPLFVEELTRALLESGNATITSREIPVTLHDSLMARLDRLGSAKEVLQIGSVIGGEFSYELLHAVHPVDDDELQRQLLRLTDADLLYVRGLAPSATYQFKHALIRDAAYEALLKSRRKELHRLAARAIDEKFSDLKDEHPEVLARHWTEAGVADMAISAWRYAGEMARNRGAFAEARESFRQVLTALNLLPASSDRDFRQVKALSALTGMLQVTKGYSAPETVEVLTRSLALAEKIGSIEEMVSLTAGVWLAASNAGDYETAVQVAKEVLSLAEREGSADSLAIGRSIQLATHYHLGNLVGVEENFDLGRPYFDSPRFKRLSFGGRASTLALAAFNAWIMGFADTARGRIKLAMGDDTNFYEAAWAQLHASELNIFLRETITAESIARQGLALSEEHGFQHLVPLFQVALGRAIACRDHQAGVTLINQGLTALGEMRSRNCIEPHLIWLSEVEDLAEASRDALTTVNQFLSGTELLVYRPEALRLRGEVWRKQGQGELAQADLLESIALARSMEAKAWELRSTMSLARLLDLQGRRDEARTMLAEIYNWFTEGFDTPDLKDAKALLEKLTA